MPVHVSTHTVMADGALAKGDRTVGASFSRQETEEFIHKVWDESVGDQ